MVAFAMAAVADAQASDEMAEDPSSVIVTGQAAPEGVDARREGDNLMPQRPVINPRPAVSEELESADDDGYAAASSEGMSDTGADQGAPIFRPEPEPISPPPQETEKNGFSGLFGWRRNKEGAGESASPAASGDVSEDDLEIPAFLRRSANN